MTVRADALIDLETTLQRTAIIGAERSVEGPARSRQRHLGFLCLGNDRSEQQTRSDKGKREAAHYGFSIGADAPASLPPPLVTAALMLVGNGNGRSKMPISGMRIRKWTK